MCGQNDELQKFGADFLNVCEFPVLGKTLVWGLGWFQSNPLRSSGGEAGEDIFSK